MKHQSLTELEQQLSYIQASPREKGEIKLILRRPDVNEREVLNQAELDLEKGLLGDNWKTRGSSKTTNGLGHPDMQLNIMNARVIEVITQDPDRWQWAGDQFYVDLDLSDENLPPGTRLKLGEAEIEVTSMPHTGCKKFADRFGPDAMKFVNSKKGKELNLRGINAKVVVAGKVETGDKMVVLTR